MSSPEGEYRQHVVHCRACLYAEWNIPNRPRCDEGVRLFALFVQEDIAKGYRLPNGEVRVVLLPRTQEST